MAAEKKTGPWTLVIQGEGSYDGAVEEDIESHAEQFSKYLEAGGHRIHSVRLSVGNEKKYENGGWHHAHAAAAPVTSNG